VGAPWFPAFEADHGGDRLISREVRDIEALDAVRRRREAQGRLQFGHAARPGEPGFELFRGQFQTAHAFVHLLQSGHVVAELSRPLEIEGRGGRQHLLPPAAAQLAVFAPEE
jgi:hypothetical protein